MAARSVEVDSDNSSRCSSVESMADDVVYVEETVEENGEREIILVPRCQATQNPRRNFATVKSHSQIHLSHQDVIMGLLCTPLPHSVMKYFAARIVLNNVLTLKTDEYRRGCM